MPALLFAAALLRLTLPAQTPHSEHEHKNDHEHRKMSAGDHMHRRFDDPAQWAKSFDDPARDAWQMPGRLLASLKLRPGLTVADIGAGTGYLTMRLAPLVKTVWAADVEPSMVAYLRERAAKAGLRNVTAVQAGEASPNLPSPVDLIVVLNTYHHIPARETYFARLAKSLKKGGRLAVIDWRPESRLGPPANFKLSAEKLTAEMTKAGYRLAEQFDYLPEQNFLVFSR